MEWHREKYWTHEEREVQKGIESHSEIRKQSFPLSVYINISWFSPNTYQDDEDETRVDIQYKLSSDELYLSHTQLYRV